MPTWWKETSSKLANEVSILKTRSLARKVAEQLLANPYLDSTRKQTAFIVRRDPDDLSVSGFTSVDTIVARLQLAVSFIPEKESDIIKIAATSEDPREAALLANTYAYAYRDQAMQQSRSQSRSVTGVSGREVDRTAEAAPGGRGGHEGFHGIERHGLSRR